MKKLAARDFEDLLQVGERRYCHSVCVLTGLYCKCSIPVFEGLLEGEHNTRLRKLLFHLAQWHALAKLRQHTDSTLSELENATTELGKILREFKDKTTSQFSTFELPREQEARSRREQRADVQRIAGDQGHTATSEIPTSRKSAARNSRKPRKLNLSTPKLHALGDYVRTIKMFGTTEGYSTQTVRF